MADIYRQRIANTPKVEEAYKAILIERDNTQAKYDDLMRKHMEARVAQGLEKEQKGERFTLIEPARLPENPFKPNRKAILLIGLVLGMGAGVGWASLREFTDFSIRSSDTLALNTSFPVLASIPVEQDKVDKMKEKFADVPQVKPYLCPTDGTLWVSDQHRIYHLGSDFKAKRVAGSNKPGNDDKKGKFARFDKPRGMVVGADGSVYVTESGNNCVRRLAPDTTVSVFAGKCSNEADDTGLDEVGALTAARFWSPIDIAYDQDGTMLVADMLNSKIKRITKDGKVEHVAGRGGKEDEDGYTVFGYSDGAALKAEFNEPAGIALGPDGTVYIADMKNNCIRSFKDGKVGTFAGKCVSGADKSGHQDGPVSKAQFNQPNGVEVAPDGTVYVADTFNHCIRMIKDGKVTTFTGQPGQQGYYDGPIKDALFNGPQSVSLGKDGSLYIVDFGNYRVRRVIP